MASLLLGHHPERDRGQVARYKGTSAHLDPPLPALRRAAAVARHDRKDHAEQSSLTRAAFRSHQKRAKRTPGSPWIANEDSSLQVREMGRAIFVVTGQCGLNLAPEMWLLAIGRSTPSQPP